MKITGILTGLISGAMLLSACDLDAMEITPTTTSNSGTGTTGGAEDTTASETGSTAGTNLTATTEPAGPKDPTDGPGTYNDPGVSRILQCDVWSPNNCPSGTKCMPWADDGGSSWNATKCTVMDPNPGQPGDICTTDGNLSGVDSCEMGAMCMNIDHVSGEGICVAFCEGTGPEDATCDSGFACSIYDEDLLILCLPTCDPVVADCEYGQTCVPQRGGDGFVCVNDASEGAGFYGDYCFSENSCAPGHYCLNPEYVMGCETAGCCSPWCDLGDDDPCPGASTECIPWFDPDLGIPPGGQDIGICGIPWN